jgi:hypothetical protein
MAHGLTWLDRLRIERVVWTLDQRLYDLPHATRVARRREVRQNLRSAAQDVGTGAALRNLGSSAVLAAEFLAAEFDNRPRHSWVAAFIFASAALLVCTSVFTDAAQGFADGIAAADPDASGTFTWGGIPYLQTSITYTFVDGESTFSGGALSLLAWAIVLVCTVLTGRLWRAPAAWRRRGAA